MSNSLITLVPSALISPIIVTRFCYNKYKTRKNLFKKFNDELKENKISEVENKNADKLIDENCKVKLDNLFNTQFQIKQFDNIITNLSMDVKKNEAQNVNMQYELENEKNDYNKKGFCKKLTLNK